MSGGPDFVWDLVLVFDDRSALGVAYGRPLDVSELVGDTF